MSYKGRLRVVYPLGAGRIVLRTEADWERDLEPLDAGDGQRFEFEVEADCSFLHFKPCLIDGDELKWANGTNKLAILGLDQVQTFYPYFTADTGGTITDVLRLASSELGREHALRVYLPSGYEENRLKHYPVIYMQDGANVFFPEEAFLGHDWQVAPTIELLRAMNLIDQTVVVGIHAGDRMVEYTMPGYEAYGRALVTEIKPFVDRRFRTLPGRRQSMVMGSSLGGVASFYVAWQWPQVIGNAACLSSTFSWRDDLFERVLSDDIEPRRGLRIYLDSGWPDDNYEATLRMASALVERGFALGKNVFHLAFPNERHDELAWAARCHLPLQLFSGRLRRAAMQARLESQ